MGKKLYLGLDIGSVSANVSVITSEKDIVYDRYIRTHGQPLETVVSILKDLEKEFPGEKFEAVTMTGTASKQISNVLGARFVNEVIAQAKYIEQFYPQVRTIIDIGGEDSKLIQTSLDSNGRLRIEDFSMNTLCAAGTGSFLDQQAHRFGLTIEEFGEIALKSETPPRIAGRCTVFAKTDMIHLQQAATPDYEIIAGLCYALVRNLKSNIAKGKNLLKPIAFQGGVAANMGVRRAFEVIFNLKEGELIIPEYFFSAGAIGASLLSLEEGVSTPAFGGVDALLRFINAHKIEAQRDEPLFLREEHKKKKDTIHPLPETGEKIEAYLGVDVGSISTNVVVIDKEGRLLAKQYLMTAGRPLEAVKKGLKAIGEAIGDKIEIVGAGTTGSGRYLTGDFIGADVIRNEITAQATASAFIDPKVDTIFEIGGQDSKYISLKNGAIVDFMMNKVCAAGTGSFLEEQAEKLGISIKKEFGELALSSKEPVRMGERCTVFMESDLVHHQQQGVKKEDLVAGLSYSIVKNYLNKVVEDRPIGNHIFYQGATAHNLGIVAAFEKVVGKPITVPPHNDVTGAIGVALLAMRERTWEKSRFKGFELSERKYEITSFECKGCPNRCEIRKVTIEGEKRPLFYGSRCDKYEVDTSRKKGEHLPDLFQEREDYLFDGIEEQEDKEFPNGEIGIPRALFFKEIFPFWLAFFNELGFKVVISEPSNKRLIHKGVEIMTAETCFPVKVAHGHVLDLIDKGIKRIFLPSVVDYKNPYPEAQRAVICPYAQALAYTVHSSIDFAAHNVEVIQPVIFFGRGDKALKKGLLDLARKLGINPFKVGKAMEKAKEAQSRFYQRLLDRGREVLEGLKDDEVAMVIVSRPYNGFDSGINLNIPKKLKDLGVLSIPMDFLPLDEPEYGEEAKYHYWRYGQKILSAAEIVRKHPQLYAIYITNFGCGPDSFIAHFFRQRLKGKPYLEIEIDEHSSDVGAVTRLEAFLDSLKNVEGEFHKETELKVPKGVTRTQRRKVYIPPMTDHSHAVAAAFEACGIEADVLPESDEETLALGRKYTSGKECYPCILTTGDMVKFIKNNGDVSNIAFFMPSGSGPCRFGQYHRFHRMVLDELGYEDVPILAPNQDERFYEVLGVVGNEFTKLGWLGIVAVDLLEKKLRETRPYEVNKGETDRVYQHHLKEICRTIREKGDLVEALKKARKDFESIPVREPGSKPVVGIVGEIYIRSNRFANENVVREIEALGGEAWLPPISEWIFYTNYISLQRAWQKRNYKQYFKLYLTNRVQAKLEHELEQVFHGSLRNLKEPSTKETLDMAHPYLHPSFEGEAILSIGKSMDYYKKGACGLVNVMPFTCMPGTIVNALLKRFREDHDNIPFLNLPFDGQEQTTTKTRLEAFMYQVYQFCERRKREV